MNESVTVFTEVYRAGTFQRIRQYLPGGACDQYTMQVSLHVCRDITEAC